MLNDEIQNRLNEQNMAKKLRDPKKGNNNLSTKQQRIRVLINSEPEIQKKSKSIKQRIRHRRCKDLFG